MNTTHEVDSPESWEVARSYAGLLGAAPSSFLSVIKMMITDGERGQTTPSPATVSEAGRLFRSARMKSVIYYATQSWQPEALKSFEETRPTTLFRLYQPFDLAALIAVTYLYYRQKRLLPGEEGKAFLDQLALAIEVGFYTGRAINKLGGGYGLLGGAGALVGQGPFLIHDAKGFKDYRRFLKSKNRFTDEQFEFHRWGCSSNQIGSVLLQSIGMGVPRAQALFEARKVVSTKDEEREEVKRFAVVIDWTQSLVRTGKAPDTVHDANYYPLVEPRQRLLQQVALLSSGAVPWLQREVVTSPQAPAEQEGEDELQREID